MGREYHKRPVGFSGGLNVPLNSVTLSTDPQTLADEGVNLVVYDTSGQANDMILPKPSIVGQVSSVVVDNQTTSAEANLNTHTTGALFWGSTNNTATIVVTSTDPDVPFIEFTAATTSQWAITGLSSTGHWTFSLSTGSTGQS